MMTFVNVFLGAPEGLEEERQELQDVVGEVNEPEGLKLGVLFVRFRFQKAAWAGSHRQQHSFLYLLHSGWGRLPGIQRRGLEYDLKTHLAIATADGVSVCDHVARS